MSIFRIIETGASPEEYDQVRERLGLAPGSPPPGAQLHLAATADDGKIRVLELWDSREQAESFTEKVRAAREQIGLSGSRPALTYMDVHNLATDFDR